jgi:hypothetical protein
MPGFEGSGPFDFYEMFSGNGAGGRPVSKTTGGKPFIITETGSTFHLAINGENGEPPRRPSAGAGRLAIKQAWWRQFLNATFLSRHPKLKAISTFEFVKNEETTWRDFTNMGDTGTGINSPFGNDAGAQDGPVLEAFRRDLMSPEIDRLIIWSNYTEPPIACPGFSTDPRCPQVTTTPPTNSSNGLQITFVTLLLGLFLMLI